MYLGPASEALSYFKSIGFDINEAATASFVAAGGEAASLEAVMVESDVVIATTGVKGLIPPELVRDGQVIMALSNPNPEIEPEVAIAHGARYAVDGKAVNNVLGFPGLFRGALDARATSFSMEMLIAAANKLSELATDGLLVPSALDREVHLAVAEEVEFTARRPTQTPLIFPREVTG